MQLLVQGHMKDGRSHFGALTSTKRQLQLCCYDLRLFRNREVHSPSALNMSGTHRDTQRQFFAKYLFEGANIA